jgi:ABC-type multidrug transport system ATPase subunit
MRVTEDSLVELLKRIYTQTMIQIQELTKKYGKTLANDHVSLRVKEGELAVLLGPNGAGKSTLIKSICGLLRFQGRIVINGFDNHALEAKRTLGYVPEIPALSITAICRWGKAGRVSGIIQRDHG